MESTGQAQNTPVVDPPQSSAVHDNVKQPMEEVDDAEVNDTTLNANRRACFKFTLYCVMLLFEHLAEFLPHAKMATPFLFGVSGPFTPSRQPIVPSGTLDHFSPVGSARHLCWVSQPNSLF
ncbi:hypothetical protein DdX_01670 [Ditylenchus destructor]|uniref:Uncharacterized protein n=1 Tax=Ditylenchus destructor TaxID=166010 RepID=A0AAD4NN87_9BILA|nr:hypothetical protein DdX_01670 [Ditylenchus destructor]